MYKRYTVLIDLDNTLMQPLTFDLTARSSALLDYLEGLGVRVIIYTSRPKWLRWITIWKLRKAGIEYDKLIMGKPRGDVYIGNRTVNFDCRYSDPLEAFRKVRDILERK